MSAASPQRPLRPPRLPQAEVPFSAASFHLEVDGVSHAAFSYCTGLEAIEKPFEYVEGGANRTIKLAGVRTEAHLVLARGVTRSTELYEWFRRGDRRDGAVILLTAAGEEAMRCRFRDGWACAWRGPALDAGVSAVALESIEIAHGGLEWTAC